jgi:UDP-3-O-[3-hydroxymyristoyl] N-acetylglucosamine deacetylase
MQQSTLKKTVQWRGQGLHSGKSTCMTIEPAPENHGIAFLRTDGPQHLPIPAQIRYVIDTMLATTLGIQSSGQTISISTVEHILAALYGLEIDNALISIDGPEVPIMDGSAAPFVTKILEAGIEMQQAPRKVLVIRKPIDLKEGHKHARLEHHTQFEIICSLDFNHPLIPSHPFHFTLKNQAFSQQIASARTFGFKQDVEALRSRGLAQGGSLDNAIVIDHHRILNPEGLRFHNECVRHKVLDALGDLSLLGYPLKGKATFHRTGHALNCSLVRNVLADPQAYEIQEMRSYPREQPRCNPLEAFDPLEIIA